MVSGPKPANEDYQVVNEGNRILFINKSANISKILTFDPESFLGWMCLLYHQGTVFELRVVRYVLLGTAAVGFCVATVTARVDALISKDFNTTPLSNLTDFLMVFLAFMTGLFVNAAFNRWQSIMKNLFAIVEALKCLYTEMVVQGIPAESRVDIRRWGLFSVFLSAHEASAKWDPPDWDKALQPMLQQGVVTEDEVIRLASKDGSKSRLPWAWIIMKLRELSEQGLAPARQTPAMVRMLDHSHQAIAALNNVENLVLFQVPHQYMHMLGFLIHVFNILNAIRCGIDLGQEIGLARKQANAKFYYMPDAMLGQVMIVNLIIMILGPLIYQAFLAISADIIIPFGSGSTDIPTRYLLDQFQHELSEMDEFFKNPSRGASLKDARTAG